MKKRVKINLDFLKNFQSRKPSAGYRSFVCNCGYTFSEKTRDCLSPSVEICPKCNNNIQPSGYKEHLE